MLQRTTDGRQIGAIAWQAAEKLYGTSIILTAFLFVKKSMMRDLPLAKMYW